MKIEKDQIDQQLRNRGWMTDRVISKSSEEKFHRFLKMAKRGSSLLNGRRIRGLQCDELWIKRGDDDSALRLRIYKPLKFEGNLPGLLWLHGGGYGLGSPEQDGSLYKRIIDKSPCIIIAPDYRLSIDAPYPAALYDCYYALLWMKQHSMELKIRPNQIAVGGESAGGGLAAALTLYARDLKEVNIAFQIPLYPMIDDRNKTASAFDNNAPIWNSRTNGWAWKLYLGDYYGKDVPFYAAAARATDFSNLPPTITFVGELEPFRDEVITYIDHLKKAGVPTYFEIFPGCYHGFDQISPKADVSIRAMDFMLKAYKYAVENYFA